MAARPTGSSRLLCPQEIRTLKRNKVSWSMLDNTPISYVFCSALITVFLLMAEPDEISRPQEPCCGQRDTSHNRTGVHQWRHSCELFRSKSECVICDNQEYHTVSSYVRRRRINFLIICFLPVKSSLGLAICTAKGTYTVI